MAIVRILLTTLLFSLNAQAATGYTTCNNGDINVVGDGYFQVDILQDGVEVSPYESHFKIDYSDIKVDVVQDGHSTYTVVNKDLEMSSEGDLYNVKLNAIMTWSKDNKTLQVAYSLDAGAFRSLELNCKEVVPAL